MIRLHRHKFQPREFLFANLAKLLRIQLNPVLSRVTTKITFFWRAKCSSSSQIWYMIYSWHIFGIHQYPYCRILSRLWLLAGFVWVLAGWVTYFRYPQYDYYQHHHHIFHEFKDQRLEERNSHTKKMLYRTPSPKKSHLFHHFATHPPPFPPSGR